MNTMEQMMNNLSTPEPTPAQTTVPPAPAPAKPWLKIAGLGILGLVLVTSLVFAGYKMSQKQPQPSPQPTPVALATPIPEETSDWKTYTNTKYGFKVKYPPSLEAIPREIDIQAQQRQYIKDCETGVISGCGGSRWPDYRINFEVNNNYLFAVTIHVIPVSKYLGGKENEGFTYQVIGSIDEKILKEIENSLEFIKADRPIKCLWFDEFVGIDINRPGIDKTIYKNASGYFYDKINNTCRPTSIYVWVDKDSTPQQSSNIPFQTQAECIASCVK